jgi:hypothetical protein
MRESRHFDFRTLALLWMVIGGVISFFNHLFVYSTPFANSILGLTR